MLIMYIFHNLFPSFNQLFEAGYIVIYHLNFVHSPICIVNPVNYSVPPGLKFAINKEGNKGIILL